MWSWSNINLVYLRLRLRFLVAIFFWAGKAEDAVFAFAGEVVQPRKKVGAAFAEARGGAADLSDGLGADATEQGDNRSSHKADDKNDDGKDHQNGEGDGKGVFHGIGKLGELLVMRNPVQGFVFSFLKTNAKLSPEFFKKRQLLYRYSCCGYDF